jgi:hypothetical protein
LNRPERKLVTYKASFDVNIGKRVGIAPPEILQYLNGMDSTDKYLPYSPTDEELRIFSEYFALLPSKFRATMERYVVGIYFISNFGGGGMSDFLYDENGKMYIALYLNPEVLKKSLEEWMEYRENSPFSANSDIVIKVESDQSYRGLLQTLVHEASHIYDYYYHETPYIQAFFKENKGTDPTPFTQGIWEDYRVPKDTLNFLSQTKYSGYGLNGQIDRSHAIPLYSHLAKSPFSSLYGSLSWAEDFAETFTWYYLKTKLGISYKVTVQKDGKTVASFAPDKDEVLPDRYRLFAGIVE